MRHVLSIFAAIATVTLGGCATGLDASRSGFLQDYEALRSDPNEPDRMSYSAPAVDWGRYETFVIERVEVRSEDLSQEDRTALATALQTALSESFGRDRLATGTPGPGTLRVRAAVTDIVKPNRALNVITGLAFGPVSRGAAAGEAEILDATTGRRLAAISWAGDGAIVEFIGFYTGTGHARTALRRFADETAALAKAR